MEKRPDADFTAFSSVHTGAMTRRAAMLDWAEPETSAALNPKTLCRMGLAPGEAIRVTTRRATIELMARADAEGMVFIPFA